MSSKKLLLKGAKESILSASNILADIEYDGSNLKELVYHRQGLVTAAHQAQQATEELNRLIGMLDALS